MKLKYHNENTIFRILMEFSESATWCRQCEAFCENWFGPAHWSLRQNREKMTQKRKMDEKRPILPISLFKSSLFRLELYIKRCRIASRIFWNHLNRCSWFCCRVIEEKPAENWTKKCHRAHGFWKRHFHYRLRIRPNLQGMLSVISWISRPNLIQFWSIYSTKISVKECFLPLTFF